MKLPKKVKFKGQEWKVSTELDLHHEDGTKCNGLCDLDTHEIIIESSLTDKEKFHCLCHELFHVLVDAARIPATTLSEDVEDILAEHFADMLHECFGARIKRG